MYNVFENCNAHVDKDGCVSGWASICRHMSNSFATDWGESRNSKMLSRPLCRTGSGRRVELGHIVLFPKKYAPNPAYCPRLCARDGRARAIASPESPVTTHSSRVYVYYGHAVYKYCIAHPNICESMILLRAYACRCME